MFTLEIVDLIVGPNANYEIKSNVMAQRLRIVSEIFSKISF